MVNATPPANEPSAIVQAAELYNNIQSASYTVATGQQQGQQDQREVNAQVANRTQTGQQGGYGTGSYGTSSY